jgi:hypothetical protein
LNWEAFATGHLDTGLESYCMVLIQKFLYKFIKIKPIALKASVYLKMYVITGYKDKISELLSETSVSRHCDSLTIIILPEGRVR